MAWTLSGNLKGPPGTPGGGGTDGENAFTLTTAEFTAPPIGETVTVGVESVGFMVLGQYLYVESAGGGSGAAGLMQVVAINGSPPGPYQEIIRGSYRAPRLPPPRTVVVPAETTTIRPTVMAASAAFNDVIIPPVGETVTVTLPPEDLAGLRVGNCLAITSVTGEHQVTVTAKLQVVAVEGNSVTLRNPG
jgi:hypothetical protein